MLKTAIDSATTAADLYDYLTDARTVEQLDLLGDLNVDEAARHLEAARYRQGKARTRQLELAQGNLESAYTIFSRRADIPWWRSVLASSRSTRQRIFISTSQIAFTNAIIYQALGYDDDSVREFLLAAEKWYLCYSESYEISLIPIGGPVAEWNPEKSVNLSSIRRRLDLERQEIAALVRKIPTIAIEPGDALSNGPWFSGIHFSSRANGPKEQGHDVDSKVLDHRLATPNAKAKPRKHRRPAL